MTLIKINVCSEIKKPSIRKMREIIFDETIFVDHKDDFILKNNFVQ